MFSRASIAIAFRRWRRNLLDKGYQSAIPPIRHHQGLRSGRESLPLMIWIIRPLDKQADGFPVLVGISVKNSLSGYFHFPYYTSKKNSTSIRMDSWSLNTVIVSLQSLWKRVAHPQLFHKLRFAYCVENGISLYACNYTPACRWAFFFQGDSGWW